MKINKTILLILMVSCLLVYAQQEFIYDSKGKRDPFLPLVSNDGYIINRESETQASDMNLEGIIYDKSGSSLAIINGNVLKVGDKIGSYIVKNIENKKVVLQSNIEEITLGLKQEE